MKSIKSRSAKKSSNKKASPEDLATSKIVPPHSRAAAVGEISAGVIAGAAAGAIAGPVGVAAGAAIGGAAGVLAAVALENDGERHSIEDMQLDEDIGVTKGSIGAPNLKKPPSKTGLYSANAAGRSSSASTAEAPAEGPISHAEE